MVDVIQVGFEGGPRQALHIFTLEQRVVQTVGSVEAFARDTPQCVECGAVPLLALLDGRQRHVGPAVVVAGVAERGRCQGIIGQFLLPGGVEQLMQGSPRFGAACGSRATEQG